MGGDQRPSAHGGNERAGRLAAAAVAVGVVASIAAWLVQVPPSAVLVPSSIGILVGLAIVPFPAADRWLAVALVLTFPLIPAVGLPNLPLSAGVILLAVLRVWRAGAPAPGAAIRVVVVVWALLVVGVALSAWPPVAIWARPVAILVLAAAASLLGVLTWSDATRRLRWIQGAVAGSIVVSVSAAVVFWLQVVVPAEQVADGLIELLGVVRGAAAAAKFQEINNWIITGSHSTLRALSPLFPAPPNVGGYLGLVAPLAAYLWFVAGDRRWRLTGLSALVLAVAVLAWTYSRSSWLAAGVAVAVIVVFAAVARWRGRSTPGPRNPGQRVDLAPALIVAVLAMSLGVIGIVATANDRALARVNEASSDPSVTSRIERDASAARIIENDPFRGAGLGNWSRLTGDELLSEQARSMPYIHNVFLEYGLAAGIFGLMWAVALVLVLVAGGLRAATLASPQVSLLGLAVVAIGAFTATQFLFDDNLLNPQYAWILTWLVGGSAVLLTSRRVAGGPVPT